MIKVGICGGIGSGKSTICSLFAERGVKIYDSDRSAKAIMTTTQVREKVIKVFGEQCYNGAELNRGYLASVVFNDKAKLEQLNSIIHPAVKADFLEWCEQNSDQEYLILECAILYESGMDKLCDITIAVLAPVEERIKRAMNRDNATREQILSRIKAQSSDDFLVEKATYSIVNFDLEDVKKDVAELDAKIKQLSKRKPC